MKPPARIALRALRDCTVIRVDLHKVPLGYRQLQVEGLVRVRAAGPHHAHIRLNDDGQFEAALLPPLPHERPAT